jgi:hypothetical protein
MRQAVACRSSSGACHGWNKHIKIIVNLSSPDEKENKQDAHDMGEFRCCVIKIELIDRSQ